MTDFQRDIDTVRNIRAVPTILDVVCRSTGMGFAAVARVTDDRWIACEVLDNVHFGLTPGGELKIESTLCNEVRSSREEIVVDDFASDPTYRDHHTPKLYGLQSYISVPIILPDGSFFGTLCAIDSKPAKLKNPQVIGMFRLFAELIAFHIDASEKLTETRADLAQQQHTSDLREQFIAVLGHDLRNPVASLQGGLGLLAKEAQSEKSARVIGLMRQSIDRMNVLINNVLDFARGRLGGGIDVSPDIGKPLAPALEQVVAEIRSVYPERRIEADIRLSTQVDVDQSRIAQLLSNLLGNAVTHGDPTGVIRVSATTMGNQFELSVSNAGQPIPPHIMSRLFDPFSRGAAGPNQKGLGLGLYIASQIAKAHGGRIDVVSDTAETRFTFRMPLTSAA